jgi:hypothetical protein
MASPPSSTRHQHQQQQHDPDNQEQSLFEQRLCEDIYGVAVRKINQNGKSNLRYVKCLYVDASEIPTTNNANTALNNNNNDDSNTTTTFSSSRSVSSRHSRGSRGGGFSRFLSGGGGGRDRDRDNGVGGGGGTPSSNSAVFDNDAHRSLLYGSNGNINTNNKTNNTHNSNNKNINNSNGKIRVLSWGKKKDVTVPLDQFTAVRKGKVTDRSRRNPCPATRIVSLITTNNSNSSSYPSLDIEAPTRLDRDKFARAFARFLNIPLLEEGDTTTTGGVGGVASNNKSKHIRSSSSSSFPQQLQYQQLQGADRSIWSNKSDMSPQSWKGTYETNNA